MLALRQLCAPSNIHASCVLPLTDTPDAPCAIVAAIGSSLHILRIHNNDNKDNNDGNNRSVDDHNDETLHMRFVPQLHVMDVGCPVVALASMAHQCIVLCTRDGEVLVVRYQATLPLGSFCCRPSCRCYYKHPNERNGSRGKAAAAAADTAPAMSSAKDSDGDKDDNDDDDDAASVDEAVCLPHWRHWLVLHRHAVPTPTTRRGVPLPPLPTPQLFVNARGDVAEVVLYEGAVCRVRIDFAAAAQKAMSAAAAAAAATRTRTQRRQRNRPQQQQQQLSVYTLTCDYYATVWSPLHAGEGYSKGIFAFAEAEASDTEDDDDDDDDDSSDNNNDDGRSCSRRRVSAADALTRSRVADAVLLRTYSVDELVAQKQKLSTLHVRVASKRTRWLPVVRVDVVRRTQPCVATCAWPCTSATAATTATNSSSSSSGSGNSGSNNNNNMTHDNDATRYHRGSNSHVHHHQLVHDGHDRAYRDEDEGDDDDADDGFVHVYDAQPSPSSSAETAAVAAARTASTARYDNSRSPEQRQRVATTATTTTVIDVTHNRSSSVITHDDVVAAAVTATAVTHVLTVPCRHTTNARYGDNNDNAQQQQQQQEQRQQEPQQLQQSLSLSSCCAFVVLFRRRDTHCFVRAYRYCSLAFSPRRADNNDDDDDNEDEDNGNDSSSDSSARRHHVTRAGHRPRHHHRRPIVHTRPRRQRRVTTVMDDNDDDDGVLLSTRSGVVDALLLLPLPSSLASTSHTQATMHSTPTHQHDDDTVDDERRRQQTATAPCVCDEGVLFVVLDHGELCAVALTSCVPPARSARRALQLSWLHSWHTPLHNRTAAARSAATHAVAASTTTSSSATAAAAAAVATTNMDDMCGVVQRCYLHGLPAHCVVRRLMPLTLPSATSRHSQDNDNNISSSSSCPVRHGSKYSYHAHMTQRYALLVDDVCDAYLVDLHRRRVVASWTAAGPMMAVCAAVSTSSPPRMLVAAHARGTLRQLAPMLPLQPRARQCIATAATRRATRAHAAAWLTSRDGRCADETAVRHLTLLRCRVRAHGKRGSIVDSASTITTSSTMTTLLLLLISCATHTRLWRCVRGRDGVWRLNDIDTQQQQEQQQQPSWPSLPLSTSAPHASSDDMARIAWVCDESTLTSAVLSHKKANNSNNNNSDNNNSNNNNNRHHDGYGDDSIVQCTPTRLCDGGVTVLTLPGIAATTTTSDDNTNDKNEAIVYTHAAMTVHNNNSSSSSGSTDDEEACVYCCCCSSRRRRLLVLQYSRACGATVLYDSAMKAHWRSDVSCLSLHVSRSSAETTTSPTTMATTAAAAVVRVCIVAGLWDGSVQVDELRSTHTGTAATTMTITSSPLHVAHTSRLILSHMSRTATTTTTTAGTTAAATLSSVPRSLLPLFVTDKTHHHQQHDDDDDDKGNYHHSSDDGDDTARCVWLVTHDNTHTSVLSRHVCHRLAANDTHADTRHRCCCWRWCVLPPVTLHSTPPCGVGACTVVRCRSADKDDGDNCSNVTPCAVAAADDDDDAACCGFDVALLQPHGVQLLSCSTANMTVASGKAQHARSRATDDCAAAAAAVRPLCAVHAALPLSSLTRGDDDNMCSALAVIEEYTANNNNSGSSDDDDNNDDNICSSSSTDDDGTTQQERRCTKQTCAISRSRGRGGGVYVYTLFMVCGDAIVTAALPCMQTRRRVHCRCPRLPRLLPQHATRHHSSNNNNSNKKKQQQEVQQQQQQQHARHHVKSYTLTTRAPSVMTELRSMQLPCFAHAAQQPHRPTLPPPPHDVPVTTRTLVTAVTVCGGERIVCLVDCSNNNSNSSSSSDADACADDAQTRRGEATGAAAAARSLLYCVDATTLHVTDTLPLYTATALCMATVASSSSNSNTLLSSSSLSSSSSVARDCIILGVADARERSTTTTKTASSLQGHLMLLLPDPLRVVGVSLPHTHNITPPIVDVAVQRMACVQAATTTAATTTATTTRRRRATRATSRSDAGNDDATTTTTATAAAAAAVTPTATTASEGVLVVAVGGSGVWLYTLCGYAFVSLCHYHCHVPCTSVTLHYPHVSVGVGGGGCVHLRLHTSRPLCGSQHTSTPTTRGHRARCKAVTAFSAACSTTAVPCLCDTADECDVLPLPALPLPPLCTYTLHVAAYEPLLQSELLMQTTATRASCRDNAAAAAAAGNGSSSCIARVDVHGNVSLVNVHTTVSDKEATRGAVISGGSNNTTNNNSNSSNSNASHTSSSSVQQPQQQPTRIPAHIPQRDAEWPVAGLTARDVAVTRLCAIRLPSAVTAVVSTAQCDDSEYDDTSNQDGASVVPLSAVERHTSLQLRSCERCVTLAPLRGRVHAHAHTQSSSSLLLPCRDGSLYAALPLSTVLAHMLMRLEQCIAQAYANSEAVVPSHALLRQPYTNKSSKSACHAVMTNDGHDMEKAAAFGYVYQSVSLHSAHGPRTSSYAAHKQGCVLYDVLEELVTLRNASLTFAANFAGNDIVANDNNDNDDDNNDDDNDDGNVDVSCGACVHRRCAVQHKSMRIADKIRRMLANEYQGEVALRDVVDLLRAL